MKNEVTHSHRPGDRRQAKDGFTFSEIPPKFKGVGTFPVRALAKLTRNKEL